MAKAYRVKPNDNVAMMLESASVEESVSFGDGVSLAVTALSDIPAGHKIALVDMLPHDRVIKYGTVIGEACADIRAGEHVHDHNMEGLRGRGDR
jgi:altronate dehydratase small subunit